MAAAIKDIVIEQGSDFTLGLLFKDARKVPMDLTGITGVAQARQNIDDETALCDFIIIFDTDRSTGKVTLFIPASVTSVLDFTVGEWDLKFTYSTGAVKRIMKGKVTLDKEITR